MLTSGSLQTEGPSIISLEVGLGLYSVTGLVGLGGDSLAGLGGCSDWAGEPAAVDPDTSGRGTGASGSMGVEVVGLKLALICLTSS